MAPEPRFIDRRESGIEDLDSADNRKFCTCPSCGMQITVGRGEVCTQMHCPACDTMMADFVSFKSAEEDTDAEWRSEWT
ncbi:MAG: hypothetical protein ACLFTH_02425 [Candidatus Woesearchaeota archaeon]